jgi:hypothetical protein
MSAPHTRGECDWCREALGDVVELFNGGLGHPACVAYAHQTVVGPDGPPWARPQRLYRQDPTIALFERLGFEAARVGIDRQKLALAISRARHAC